MFYVHRHHEGCMWLVSGCVGFCTVASGGFALGCVFMVLLEELSSPFGGEAMFYIAGAFTGLSSLLFLTLPSAQDHSKQVNTSKTSEIEENSKPKLHDPMTPVRVSLMPSGFTLSCSCLGVLAVGLEVGFAFFLWQWTKCECTV